VIIESELYSALGLGFRFHQQSSLFHKAETMQTQQLRRLGYSARYLAQCKTKAAPKLNLHGHLIASQILQDTNRTSISDLRFGRHTLHCHPVACKYVHSLAAPNMGATMLLLASQLTSSMLRPIARQRRSTCSSMSKRTSGGFFGA